MQKTRKTFKDPYKRAAIATHCDFLSASFLIYTILVSF